MAHRQLKKELLQLLDAPDWPAALDAIGRLPARQVVNPLFGLLYHGDPLVRWRAVTAMGIVVAAMAATHIEQARIVMRRLMWNLNDESGGMGWGSPEAMGEIMARHPALAREYGAILVSYADPGGNYLEHPGLQRGVLWALGRLGRVQPQWIERAAVFIEPHLSASDPDLRGLALWALMPVKDPIHRTLLIPLLRDDQRIVIYIDQQLASCRIGDLAQAALSPS